jgi:hypothetical protein
MGGQIVEIVWSRILSTLKNLHGIGIRKESHYRYYLKMYFAQFPNLLILEVPAVIPAVPDHNYMLSRSYGFV